MQQFLLKLIPPRADFPWTMSENEAAQMREHAALWKSLTERGVCVAYGPVLDPAWPWGLGIVEVEDEAAARALFSEDPTVKSGLNRFEVYPMRLAGVRSTS